MGRRGLQGRRGGQDHRVRKENRGRLGRKGREACQGRKDPRDPAVRRDRQGLRGRPDLKDHKECRVCRGRRGQQDRKDPSGPWVTLVCQDQGASPVPRDRPDRREIPGQQDRLGASASRANWGRPDLSEQPVAGAIPVRPGRQGQRDQLETLELWGRQAHRALKESRRLSPAPLVQRVRLARQAPRANLVLRESRVRKGSPVLRAN